MKTLIQHIKNLKTEKEIKDFLESLFTADEINEFETRLKIIKLLIKGYSQRAVAEKLNVGVATVSRGARELKNKKFKFLTAN